MTAIPLAPPPTLDERQARQLMLLRACEAGPADDPLWSTDDAQWATRVAQASLGPGPRGAAVVVDRAMHAAQRLRARDAALGRFLDSRFALGPWLLAALLLGLATGLAMDQIGHTQRINLLAAPIAAVLLWNGLVYLAIALQWLLPAAAGRGLRRRLSRLWQPRLDGAGLRARLAADWAQVSAPLNAARAALLLHGAAAALALGLVAGGYARGLVLDYRAGWQSTFLEPATVHALLATALAPASALTGIAVPGTEVVASLRVTPDQPAQAPAAPWLHLFAATLTLFVVGPRLLLALAAAARAAWLRRHWPLPWHEPYFQALLRAAEGRAATVWLLPHAAVPGAGQALALQALLAAASGPDARLRVAEPVALGHEHEAPRCTPPAGTTLVLVLADLASTPEPEAHGRLLQTLAQAAPAQQRALLLDEAAFLARFGTLPLRLQQRRHAWQQLADEHGVPLLRVNLSQPEPAAEAVQAWRRQLGG